MSAPSRVLVVDDDAGMRYAIERVLAPPHQVEAVAGAAEALARAGAAAYDLAMVDVRLRDGDGYQVCQALRALRPETDVILITGSTSEPDEKLYRALEEGAFYFLFKPFDRRVLTALVERCLTLAAALDGLLAAVREHCAGRPLQDDVTLLLIERERAGG